MEFVDEIQPYSYEPEYTEEELRARADGENSSSDSEIDSDEEVESLDRLDLGTTWCECGECMPMPTVTERICCQDWTLLHERLEQANISCIKTHPGLISLTNPDVLIALFINFMMWKKSGENAPEVLSNRQSRLMAYRHFIGWALRGHGLGRGKRLTIPSCVVNRIRQSFPEENGQYVGFKEHRDALAMD